jgi:hypothetical protein
MADIAQPAKQKAPILATFNHRNEGMSSAVGGLANTVAGMFSFAGSVVKTVFWGAILAALWSAASSAYYWKKTDEEATIKRGTEICQSHGFVAGKTDVGGPMKGNQRSTPAVSKSNYAYSNVSCDDPKGGLRVFFEFPTVMKP